MTTTAPTIGMPAHVLRASDLDEDQLSEVLRSAERMKRTPYALTGALVGRTLMTLFDTPSTRTRAALAAAAQRLGMLSVELEFDRGESIEDTARVLSSYCSAITVGIFEQGELEQFAAAASVPVINALSVGHRPCQALADLLTLHEHFGRLQGLKLAYVGDANNVTHSLLEMGARAGLNVSVASPEGHRPDPDVVAVARGLGVLHGGAIEITSDPVRAAWNADAIYTAPWASPPGDLRPYRVDAALMGAAHRDAVFLHCLPAHRGEEVAAEVIDGPQSLVFSQAANCLPTAQALLHALVRASEH